jgi:thioredoxin 1
LPTQVIRAIVGGARKETPMATVELNKDNLEDIIQNSKTLFIDFWAAWCGPCKMFGPVFEAAAAEHEDIVFAKCDTDAEKEVAAAFGIQSIPTLAVFKEQVMIFKQAGALPAPALEEMIGKVKDLDMDEVRKELAAAEAEEEESE